MMVRLRSGLLLHPQWRGVAVIEDSEWHYPFFNTDMVRTVLSQAIEVLYYGYTPYISLKDRQEGETNWDTFFRQPFDCNLSCEWGGAKRVFCYSKMKQPYGYYTTTPYFPWHYHNWCRVFQSLVRLNEPTQAYIDHEYESLFRPEEKVLGVLCRGTDYIGFKGLPVQPDVETVIRDAKVWMERYGYTKIYLATECSSIYNAFCNAFAGQIITNKRTYYDTIMQDKQYALIGQVSFERPHDNYLKGLEYLSSLVLLSHCRALLAGNCGGSLFSLFYNNRQYERFQIYRLGNY